MLLRVNVGEIEWGYVRARARDRRTVVDHEVVRYKPPHLSAHTLPPSWSPLTVNNSKPALPRNIAHNRLQPLQIRLVERPAHPPSAGRAHALHEERDPKRVEARAHEEVDGRRRRPRVVLAELPWDDGVPELGPGLVHAEVGELGARAGAERGGRGRGGGGCCRGGGGAGCAGLALGVVCAWRVSWNEGAGEQRGGTYIRSRRRSSSRSRRLSNRSSRYPTTVPTVCQC